MFLSRQQLKTTCHMNGPEENSEPFRQNLKGRASAHISSLKPHADIDQLWRCNFL